MVPKRLMLVLWELYVPMTLLTLYNDNERKKKREGELS